MTVEELRRKARELVAGRLERAAGLTEADLFAMNLNLPVEHKYRSVREVQTVMVKGAFDALAFSVELGLLRKDEATAYWQQLHQRYGSLWPAPTNG